MNINILNNDAEKFDMEYTDEILEVYPWIVLNINEIGNFISQNLLNVDYKITQEVLDEEIRDYLSNIHKLIIERAIQNLEKEKIEVL